MAEDDKPKRKEPSGLGGLLRYGMAASELGFAVLGGLALGYWLDRLCGTSPWLTVAGLLLGFIGGLWTLIRLVNTLMEKERSNQDR